MPRPWLVILNQKASAFAIRLYELTPATRGELEQRLRADVLRLPIQRAEPPPDFPLKTEHNEVPVPDVAPHEYVLAIRPTRASAQVLADQLRAQFPPPCLPLTLDDFQELVELIRQKT